MKTHKTYTNKINQLESNQVFCFGSNPVGIQGAGAALFCSKRGWCTRDEKMNNCLSKSKKSWGIVTVTYPGKRKSISLEKISDNINKLYKFASSNNDKEFLVAYTGINGRNLNGWSNLDLAWAFTRNEIPNNIIFEEEFYKLIIKFENEKIDEGSRGFIL